MPLATTQAAAKKRKRTQPFTAPKDKNTKTIIKQNATSSPLLKLPIEIRQRIWGYVLGGRLIHIDHHCDFSTHPHEYRPSNTICQATITEKEAYELSKSAEYNKKATSFKAGEDMRYCRNRHATCYTELTEALQKKTLPPNSLDVRALRVCRQAYVDANPILWGTNTWSFSSSSVWRDWRQARNALQRRLIKKVHLSQNIVLRPVTKASISEFKVWEELHLDIGTWVRWFWHQDILRTHGSQCLRQFFRAENITVISTDSWDTFSRDSDADDSDDSDDSDGTSFEDKVATAEECRSHLITLQNEAARKEEDKKRGKQLAAEEESTGDGNSGEAKQLTAEGEDNVEDGGSAESQIA